MHHNYDNNQERLACLGVRIRFAGCSQGLLGIWAWKFQKLGTLVSNTLF